MIVNPGKFQTIILDKKKNNHTQETIKINNKAVKVKSSVKFHGFQIDSELNFNLYIANIWRSAANRECLRIFGDLQRINLTLLLGLQGS